jgi:hypothetical protein
MALHAIEVDNIIWDAIASDELRFLLIPNDRHFQRRDLLHIVEIMKNGCVDRERPLKFRIGWIQTGNGLKRDFCVLQLKELDEEELSEAAL